MNPIVRMMKRYINLPLKYALPLLFIGALVLASTTGCAENTATPTPTVKATVAATTTVKTTATPKTTVSFDPLLAKLVPTLKAEYGSNMVEQRAKGTNINFDAV
jgi:hypothetical protein